MGTHIEVVLTLADASCAALGDGLVVNALVHLRSTRPRAYRYHMTMLNTLAQHMPAYVQILDHTECTRTANASMRTKTA